MARGNDCIVNTLPGICEQPAIFYFQDTNQTIYVKYAIMSSLGFSRRYFQLMRGYSSYWVVHRRKKLLKQAEIIEAFKSTSRYLDELLNIDNP